MDKHAVPPPPTLIGFDGSFMPGTVALSNPRIGLYLIPLSLQNPKRVVPAAATRGH